MLIFQYTYANIKKTIPLLVLMNIVNCQYCIGFMCNNDLRTTPLINGFAHKTNATLINSHRLLYCKYGNEQISIGCMCKYAHPRPRTWPI